MRLSLRFYGWLAVRFFTTQASFTFYCLCYSEAMKSQTQKNPLLTPHAVTITVALLVLFQILTLIVITRQHLSTHDTLTRIAEQQAQSTLGTFEATPIVDAANKRLYIPEIAAYLPLNTDTMDVLYRITDTTGGGTSDLVFASKLNKIAASSANADQQECLNLVRIELGAAQSQPRSNETAQEPFALADGRMLYPYLPKNPTDCQTDLPVQPQQIADSIRQLQSY